MKKEGDFSEERIPILVVIVILIDSFLIYILKNEKVEEFEKGFIYLVFLCHLLFLSSLLAGDMHSRDNLHMFYVVAVGFASLFITNKKILILLITIILTMLLFWYIDGCCPIGSVKNTIPEWDKFYNNNKSIFTIWPIMIILILSAKLFI